MTTNENILPADGDLKPLDNHASGVEVKPLNKLDNDASDEEIQTLDNHASGPRP